MYIYIHVCYIIKYLLLYFINIIYCRCCTIHVLCFVLYFLCLRNLSNLKLLLLCVDAACWIRSPIYSWCLSADVCHRSKDITFTAVHCLRSRNGSLLPPGVSTLYYAPTFSLSVSLDNDGEHIGVLGFQDKLSP